MLLKKIKAITMDDAIIATDKNIWYLKYLPNQKILKQSPDIKTPFDKPM